MSDKISDTTVEMMASGMYLPHLAEIVLVARELLARRAAEVKPVKVRIFSDEEAESRADLSDDYWTGYLDCQWIFENAIKAAGGTVEE